MNKATETKFTQPTPDRVEVKRGGGCLSIFGIPFFLAGIFMLLVTLQIVPVSNADEIPWFGWIILLFMSLVFTGVGGGLVFGRLWITIDKTRRRIFKARGLLKPMRGEQYDLNSYVSVIIKHNPGDSDTAETFPVSLRGADGTTELELTSYNNYGTAFS